MASSDSRPSVDEPADPAPSDPHEVAEPEPEVRRWWHDAENPEQDLLHRVLIASPWERYLLDRDVAEPDAEPPHP